MKKIGYTVCSLLALMALAGCGQSSEAPPSSAAQVKAFQGGPMTPEQIKQQNARQQQVMQQSKQKPPAAARR